MKIRNQTLYIDRMYLWQVWAICRECYRRWRRWNVSWSTVSPIPSEHSRTYSSLFHFNNPDSTIHDNRLWKSDFSWAPIDVLWNRVSYEWKQVSGADHQRGGTHARPLASNYRIRTIDADWSQCFTLTNQRSPSLPPGPPLPLVCCAHARGQWQIRSTLFGN